MVAKLVEKEKEKQCTEVKGMTFLQLILLLSLNCCLCLGLGVLKPAFEKYE